MVNNWGDFIFGFAIGAECILLFVTIPILRQWRHTLDVWGECINRREGKQ